MPPGDREFDELAVHAPCPDLRGRRPDVAQVATGLLSRATSRDAVGTHGREPDRRLQGDVENAQAFHNLMDIGGSTGGRRVEPHTIVTVGAVAFADGLPSPSVVAGTSGLSCRDPRIAILFDPANNRRKRSEI
jgi:hypothetical protein